MPLTLSYTEGALPKGAESSAVQQITDAFLKWHHLADHPLMKPNVTAQVHELAKTSTFSGGEPFSGIWVEWKVPGIAFGDREVQQGFFDETTQIIKKLTHNQHPEEHIYINVVQAIDGGWSINGSSKTNQELAQALASA